MTPTYYQNQINRIEKEIADLYKKIAAESKRGNDKNKQINTVNKSITKSTSLSSLQSKQRQIQGYQNNIFNCKKKIADYQKKISTKTTELGNKKLELRKSEDNKLKKQNKKQLDFHREMKRSIEEQKNQLDNLINQYYSSKTPLTEKESYNEQKQYDFFISHASEDKGDIVRSLADALRENGFQVWYDEFELKIGDSLRKKIDAGLINSRFGIVIISPSFVKKNWTEYELNGMVAREMNGHKVILPIWHKISKDEVLNLVQLWQIKWL